MILAIAVIRMTAGCNFRIRKMMRTPTEGVWAHAAAGFDGQEWYQQLFDFGAPPGSGEEESDVVPALVRNIITPLAIQLVSKVGKPPLAQQRSSKSSSAVPGEAAMAEDYAEAGPFDRGQFTFVDGPSTAPWTVWADSIAVTSGGVTSHSAAFYVNLDGGAPDMAVDVTLNGGATQLTAANFML